MKNRNILKKIYNLITDINNAYINIFIEEIFENQIELHLNREKISKNNLDLGLRIIIEYNNQTYYKSFKFLKYDEIYTYIVHYIEKVLNKKINHQYSINNVKLKKNNSKNVYLNKQKKYKLMNDIIKSFDGYNKLKVSFYERKEKIYIIQNNKNYIFCQKNFYTKIMLKGIIQENEVFDFILSDSGYKNINNSSIINLINRFNTISYIKINKQNINDGDYDLILSNNCGTVFHEMFGHNLELTLIEKFKLKLFKKNQYIYNDLITYIDNPKIKNLLNIKYDDYANIRKKLVLINKGIIKEYIDKNTLRSENYNYFPANRMSNSYLAPNKNIKDFDYGNIKNGIYIFKIKSGRLFLEKQKFEIIIDAGYLIKNGKIISTISNVSFIVDITEFIKKIKYVGNDLNFVPTVCGASSGNIFVYAGCPTVCVKNISINQL